MQPESWAMHVIATSHISDAAAGAWSVTTESPNPFAFSIQHCPKPLLADAARGRIRQLSPCRVMRASMTQRRCRHWFRSSCRVLNDRVYFPRCSVFLDSRPRRRQSNQSDFTVERTWTMVRRTWRCWPRPVPESCFRAYRAGDERFSSGRCSVLGRQLREPGLSFPSQPSFHRSICCGSG